MSSQSDTETIEPPSDPDFEVLASVIAQLYFFQSEFEYKGDVIAQIVHPLNNGPYDYLLVVWQNGNRKLVHRIASSMNQRWAKRTGSLTWNYESEAGTQSSWCIALLESDQYEPFKGLFTQVMWESLHQESWNKVKVCIVYTCQNMIAHVPIV